MRSELFSLSTFSLENKLQFDMSYQQQLLLHNLQQLNPERVHLIHMFLLSRWIDSVIFDVFTVTPQIIS
jgi:hypothetical protein